MLADGGHQSYEAPGDMTEDCVFGARRRIWHSSFAHFVYFLGGGQIIRKGAYWVVSLEGLGFGHCDTGFLPDSQGLMRKRECVMEKRGRQRLMNGVSLPVLTRIMIQSVSVYQDWQNSSSSWNYYGHRRTTFPFSVLSLHLFVWSPRLWDVPGITIAGEHGCHGELMDCGKLAQNFLTVKAQGMGCANARH